MTSDSQEGFVLPLVLAVLIVLAAFATTISDWVADALGLAVRGDERIAADARLMSARETTLWRLVTGHFTPSGLSIGAETVALDGRAYSLDGVTLRLMDEGGLVNLVDVDEDGVQRLLRAFDLSPDREAALARAFATDRTRRGPFLTPWDLQRIPDWATAAALWREGRSVADLVGVARGMQGINLNTAPAPVLQTISDLTPGTVEALIQAREHGPITFDDASIAVTGSGRRPDPLHVFLMPSDTIRLSFGTPGESLTWVQSITVTPAGMAPIKVNFAAFIPQPNR